MPAILFMTLLLLGCSPDMDGIIATADNEVLLPADPDDSNRDKCMRCAIKNCSNQRLECQKHESCSELLERKSEYRNPNDLLSIGDDIETDNEGQRKYQSYFDCVFWYPKRGYGYSYDNHENLEVNGCGEECGSGESFTCKKESRSNEIKEKIKLIIHINQIKHMFMGRKMISPGEHCVCVQWVKENKEGERGNEIDCTAEENVECENGNMTEPISDTKDYTDGFGEVTLFIERGEDGYLLIKRGDYDGLGSLTFDDLGPFIYYLVRPLTKDQEITLSLPQRVQEINWAKRYWTKKHSVEQYEADWPFNDGGIVTVLTYDCLNTPASVIFEIRDIDVDGEEIDSEYDEVFWNQVVEPSLIEYGDTVNVDTVPGISSFFIKVENSRNENTDEKLVSIVTEDSLPIAGRKVQIRKNHTTFVALYPRPK